MSRSNIASQKRGRRLICGRPWQAAYMQTIFRPSMYPSLILLP